MANQNYFSHNSLDGRTPWDRIRAAGYTYNTWLGENIAAGFESAASVLYAWSNSPSHNANMLSSNFRAIGVGRCYNGNSQYGWYWTTDFGGVADSSYPIIGDIRVRYDALVAAPGIALDEEYPVYDSGSRWIGQAQDFTNGRLIWNKDTRQVFWVYGAILAKYDATGREAGWLGLPTSDEYGAGGGRANTFYGGHIYWSAATGAHEVHGAILTKLLSLGGVGVTGVPTTDEFDTPGISGFKESDFQRGRIYWSSSTGARAIYGAIFAKFAEKGALGAFGLPLADETDVEGVPGARMSSFENHVIYWSATTGAREVHGAILAKFVDKGGTGLFGLPATDVFDVQGITGAQEADFQGGRIYTSAAGTREVHGAILAKYLAMGGPQAHGLPVTDETEVTGVTGARYNDFERAYIGWTPANGARMVYGAIFTKFKSKGGTGFFGLPAGDEYGVPGGRASNFPIGNIYWSAATGAFEVHGDILTRYLTLGGPSGFMGFPVSDEMDSGVTGARESRFQGANIYWSPATGTHIVYGGILGKYLSVGGPAGSLGLPTSDEKPGTYVPGSRQSDFQHGYIWWTSANGATIVLL